MRTVKHICKYCNKAEEFTTLELIEKTLSRFVISFFTMLGILFFFYVWYVGLNPTVSAINSAHYTNFERPYDSIMRNLTILIVSKQCEMGANLDCTARAIYANLSRLQYFYSSTNQDLYPPMETYRNGGDCKNLAMLYVSMMNSIGYTAQVACNADLHHCVAVVPKSKTYYMIDLTIPNFKEFNITQNFWEEYKYNGTEQNLSYR